MRNDVHSFAQIEPMGPETLHTGVEMKLRTTSRSRLGLQPMQQLAAKPS